MLKYRAHGKWILAGEHSVLRGSTALVFPIKSRYLDFEYNPTQDKLSVVMDTENASLKEAFWGVMNKALQTLDIEKEKLKGKIFLNSNIPVGAGMGASATLCVSIARWMTDMGFIQANKQYEFAKSLEDYFHGQSSGVDVAVALNDQALEFSQPDKMKKFTPVWTPFIYLSYCGQRGDTAQCVRQVKNLIEQDFNIAKKVDQKMEEAVKLAKTALLERASNNLETLKKAIQLAHSCFESWGLIKPELRNHMKNLEISGAIATKPTGSGNGGFVISLWSQPPQTQWIKKFNLIEA